MLSGETRQTAGTAPTDGRELDMAGSYQNTRVGPETGTWEQATSEPWNGPMVLQSGNWVHPQGRR